MSADTPMFRQYRALKSQHPDALLFFRMGDFYELFFDDARVAAELLDLTLTSRNKDAPEPVPMAGVPHHAVRGYLQTLVDSGHKVAIADQVEDPRTARGLVRREITRVVSPGVLLDPDGLEAREPCWLLGLARDARTWGIALLDVSTGDVRVAETAGTERVAEEIGRVEARELLLPGSLELPPAVAAAASGALETRLDDDVFDAEAALRSLCRRFGVADLSGFGCEGLGVSLGAAAALLAYAEGNSGAALPHVSEIRPYRVSGHMVVDEITRRNLEVFRPLFGRGRKGTLVGLVDRAVTAAGGRLTREWLARPLVDLGRIRRRLDMVEALVGAGSVRAGLRSALRRVADIERIGGKVGQGTAGPRDLVALRRSLEALPDVFGLLAGLPPCAELVPDDTCGDVAADVARWLVDDPPVTASDGAIVRPGADPELDELARLASDGRSVIAEMERRERIATGIGSLKIRFSKVHGYYIEVTRTQLAKVPDHYIRRQSLSTAERFFTPELKEFEERVVGAEERRKVLERRRFEALRDRIARELARLQAAASAVARVDALAGFAELAVANRYVRPAVDDSTEIDVEGGRHPVVEAHATGERFVPNDIRLGQPGRRFVILTGPNMSGKSTIMRQVALIVLLAQAGSFVPADRARVGLCDRIFTRVGASDDLASGRSTFMVEMSETARILRSATERSLVLLDEIGRGTSTYDGLAIAWAVAERLHDRHRCRAIFATHYHELVELAQTRKGVANLSVAVTEWQDGIVFLRKLREGGASRSYGIQCARLAGMPPGVVERARVLLARLERHAAANPGPQLGLFDRRPEPAPEPAPDPLREALAGVDADSLSPREALELLYRLKELAG